MENVCYVAVRIEAPDIEAYPVGDVCFTQEAAREAVFASLYEECSDFEERDFRRILDSAETLLDEGETHIEVQDRKGRVLAVYEILECGYTCRPEEPPFDEWLEWMVCRQGISKRRYKGLYPSLVAKHFLDGDRYLGQQGFEALEEMGLSAGEVPFDIKALARDGSASWSSADGRTASVSFVFDRDKLTLTCRAEFDGKSATEVFEYWEDQFECAPGHFERDLSRDLGMGCGSALYKVVSPDYEDPGPPPWERDGETGDM